MSELNSLHDLFVEQLQDLYDAEQRLTKALPEMIEAAHCGDLKQALQAHLEETERQIERLEHVFEEIGETAEAKTCQAMKGLIAEGEEVIKAKGNAEVRDAALIAAAQRVEHYEIAGYGTCRAFAQRLGFERAAEMLQETLDEESGADRKLTEIAEQTVNAEAQQAEK